MMARLALVAVALTSVTAFQAPRPPVFRASVDSVIVSVSVTAAGRPLSGLTAADFELRDNGVPQTILLVDRETVPIDVTLILDTSQSVQGVMQYALVRAVNTVAAQLRSDDRLTLISFSHRIREHLRLADPRQFVPLDARGEVTAPSNGDVGASFLAALEAFRTAYVLSYVVERTERGGWHDIAVRVTRPGQHQVRARKTYFGG